MEYFLGDSCNVEIFSLSENSEESDYVPSSTLLLAESHLEINRRFDSIINDSAFSGRTKCKNLNII